MSQFFLFDPDTGVAKPITAREADRDYRDTDAGITYDDFVILASSVTEATEAGQEWVACWADEDEGCVPDGMMLEERDSGRRSHGQQYYMILRVL